MSGVRHWILVGLASVLLSTLPAYADHTPYRADSSNWYGDHHTWASWCNDRADSQGRWGRARQYDRWCHRNMRYRNTRPDQQRMSGHQWDHGNQTDHGSQGQPR